MTHRTPTAGLEPAGLARCLRGKREPVASGASVYLPVFQSQPELGTNRIVRFVTKQAPAPQALKFGGGVLEKARRGVYCTRLRAHRQPPGSPGRLQSGYFDGGPLACTSHAPQALEKMGCGCGQHQHLSTRTRELRAGCGLVSWMAAAAAATAAAAVLAASWSGCCSAAAAPVSCGCWLLVRCGRCCCLCLCLRRISEHC